MTDHRRSELANFLRSRRERLLPEPASLGNGRRRRTPGLRREEVAERAGIGVDWYLRLEQGRAVSPSSTTIDALARALCLDEAEHTHLRALARSKAHRTFARETVPDAIRHLVASLDRPAYITGRRCDILLWNDAAAAVFGDVRHRPEADRNILVYMLTEPAARHLFGAAWADEARRMIGQFRSTHDLMADDPAFLDLLRRLGRGCPEFEAWWQAHDIRSGGSGRKVLNHPEMGRLCFEYATFQANDDPALKLAIYTPVSD